MTIEDFKTLTKSQKTEVVRQRELELEAMKLVLYPIDFGNNYPVGGDLDVVVNEDLSIEFWVNGECSYLYIAEQDRLLEIMKMISDEREAREEQREQVQEKKKVKPRKKAAQANKAILADEDDVQF